MRILLSRTDAIGDLILTLPVARSIKGLHPDFHVTMLVSEYTEPLLETEKYIDGVIAIPSRELGNYVEVRELADLMKTASFDAVIFFYPRFSLVLAARMAKIPIRIGTGYRIYSLLLNRRVKQHRKQSDQHELDLNYELADSFLPGLPRHEPRLNVSDLEIDSANRLLSENGIAATDPFVIVHPLSRGSAPNWRPERYVSLIRQLAASGVPVVVTGAAHERQQLDNILSGSSKGVINLAGATDLHQLKGLIKTARLTVSSSTGPIHIATAVGTFAVGIYPPQRALSPVRWGPRGGANKLFVPAVTSNKGPIDELMSTIKVEDVLSFILAKLETGSRLGL